MLSKIAEVARRKDAFGLPPQKKHGHGEQPQSFGGRKVVERGAQGLEQRRWREPLGGRSAEAMGRQLGGDHATHVMLNSRQYRSEGRRGRSDAMDDDRGWKGSVSNCVVRMQPSDARRYG